MPQDVSFTWQRAAVVAALLARSCSSSMASSVYDWYLTELSAVFAGLAIVAAILAGMWPNRVAREFCGGAAELTTTALLIGFARTIEVVLNEGMIRHRDPRHRRSARRASRRSSAVGMLCVQSVCNFFIPSGSRPGLRHHADHGAAGRPAGSSRQVAVLAYQFGDGFTNMVVPTNALLMGMLALAASRSSAGCASSCRCWSRSTSLRSSRWSWR